MMIELSEQLEAALRIRAIAQGLSPAGYISEMLQRELATELERQPPAAPFITGRGALVNYGSAPSAEEIDANRADMFRNFGGDL